MRAAVVLVWVVASVQPVIADTPPPPAGPPSTQAPVDPYAPPPRSPPPPVLWQFEPSGQTELIVDFSVVGTLAATQIILRQDVSNGTAGTFIVLAGVGGGGALGWLLADKYQVTSGTAHATTIGLLAGAANAALLIRPTETYDGDDVIGLLFLGSALGAGGGFLYGQTADLTGGQSMFVGNTVLLGTATAALTAIAGSRNDSFDSWENAALAIGLDAGLLAGALIAPRLTWSPRRAQLVFAATAIGALVGGALPGLITKRDEGEDYNGDLIAGCMTAGLWGGFGLGIVATRDMPAALAPPPAAAGRGVPALSTTQIAPWLGDRGQLGVLAGGMW